MEDLRAIGFDEHSGGLARQVGPKIGTGESLKPTFSNDSVEADLII